jgi:hypothetical protein
MKKRTHACEQEACQSQAILQALTSDNSYYVRNRQNLDNNIKITQGAAPTGGSVWSRGTIMGRLLAWGGSWHGAAPGSP